MALIYLRDVSVNSLQLKPNFTLGLDLSPLQKTTPKCYIFLAAVSSTSELYTATLLAWLVVFKDMVVLLL